VPFTDCHVGYLHFFVGCALIVDLHRRPLRVDDQRNRNPRQSACSWQI